MSNLHFRTLIRKDNALMVSAVMLTEDNFADVVIYANSRHFGSARLGNDVIVLTDRIGQFGVMPGNWVADFGNKMGFINDIEDWLDYERPGLPLTAEFEKRRPVELAAFESSQHRPRGKRADVRQYHLTEAGKVTYPRYSGNYSPSYAVKLTSENAREVMQWAKDCEHPARYGMAGAEGVAALVISNPRGDDWWVAEDEGEGPNQVWATMATWVVYLAGRRFVVVDDTETFEKLFVRIEGK